MASTSLRLVTFGILVAGCSASASQDVLDATVGPELPDALPPDGNLQLPVDQPVVPCTDSIPAVYMATAPAGAALGQVVACAKDGSETVEQVSDRVRRAVDDAPQAKTALNRFRIAYVTRNGRGEPTVSSAKVLLPVTAAARPVDRVVALHGSVGLADECAPTKDDGADSDIVAYPLAGQGYPTIYPDFAGLGTAGTQEYLDNRAQGWQTLDAARALRALLPSGPVSERVALVGFSQGGGAVLSAHSLAAADHSVAPDFGQLAATVAIAPQWPINLESFDYKSMLGSPDRLTILSGLGFSAVAVLRQYAWFENQQAGAGKTAFPANLRSSVESAVNSQCLIAFGGYVQSQMRRFGDLIDDSLRSGLLQCEASNGAIGCSGEPKRYWEFLRNNELAPSASGGPVLFVQGGGDQIMPANKEASCANRKLIASSVQTQACLFSTATHSNIARKADVARLWVTAQLTGTAMNLDQRCDETELPRCER